MNPNKHTPWERIERVVILVVIIAVALDIL